MLVLCNCRLRPLNKVSIRDSALLPGPEEPELSVRAAAEVQPWLWGPKEFSSTPHEAPSSWLPLTASSLFVQPFKQKQQSPQSSRKVYWPQSDCWELRWHLVLCQLGLTCLSFCISHLLSFLAAGMSEWVHPPTQCNWSEETLNSPFQGRRHMPTSQALWNETSHCPTWGAALKDTRATHVTYRTS